MVCRSKCEIQTIKLLEETIGEKRCKLDLGDSFVLWYCYLFVHFLDKTPKARLIIKENNSMVINFYDITKEIF